MKEVLRGWMIAFMALMIPVLLSANVIAQVLQFTDKWRPTWKPKNTYGDWDICKRAFGAASVNDGQITGQTLPIGVGKAHVKVNEAGTVVSGSQTGLTFSRTFKITKKALLILSASLNGKLDLEDTPGKAIVQSNACVRRGGTSVLSTGPMDQFLYSVPDPRPLIVSIDREVRQMVNPDDYVVEADLLTTAEIDAGTWDDIAESDFFSSHDVAVSAIWYKDSENPTGIPDFGQEGRQDCGAVAAANCLWYWDHHGFPGLVTHTNANNHSQNWVNDSRQLIRDLRHLIYERGGNGLGMERGISRYIKDRGHSNSDGLKVAKYEGREADYGRLKSELERCQTVMAQFGFWVRNEVTGDEGFLGDLTHEITAAGIHYASPPTKAIFSNGEDDDHNGEDDPVNRIYYNELPMADPDTTNGKLRIPDPHLTVRNLPAGYRCLYAQMIRLHTICPSDTLAPGKRMTGTYASTDSGYVRYHYTVYNDIEPTDSSSIALVGLAIDSPFDTTTGFITSPPGWEWVLWNPKETPTLCTPGPVNDPDSAFDWEPAWTGILWYTETTPILPGDSVTCFSFRAPDQYPPTPWACFRGFSSADSGDAISDFGYTLGPHYLGLSSLRIPNTDCVNPGDYVSLPILLENNTGPFGGFELEVEFDYTSMCFVDVKRGSLIDSSYTEDGIFWSWELFTYRLLPCPVPPCQNYKILLYGMAEIPNGSTNRGLPIWKNPEEVGGDPLVLLNFVVMNDENLRGYKIPVCWEWEGVVVNDTLVEDWDCGENTFSSWSGDTLYTSVLLCQFNPEICDDPTGGIQPALIFQDGVCGQNCGGVDVCPADSVFCKRGDVNANTVTYEVADAVLFARYFVEGLSVFIYDQDYQVCATDVNADGRPLTLSDFVYLVRVILHDAVEIPKLAPSSEVVNVLVSNNTITTECASPIGAILFEFDSAVIPTLLASNMEMVNKENKVLVWSREGNTIKATTEVISFAPPKAGLTNVSAVDYDTRELKTSIVGKRTPITFALNPAYPNPFNPFTNLSFTLPEALAYSLKIYNVAGQLVRSYEGMGSAGLNVISWDSKDNAGDEVASGIYFYKLTAGGFSATRKMVVVK